MDTSVRGFVLGTCSNAVSNAETHADVVQHLENLNGVFSAFAHDDGVSKRRHAIFFAMSHANFLSACALALSGQPPPAYMAARGALESALYYFWCERQPKAFGVWADRERDDISRARARSLFKIGPMMKTLDQEHPSIGNQFHKAYDNSIDFGAHPNYLAFLTNVEQREGATKWMAVSSEPVVLRHTAFALAYSGLTSLAVVLAAGGDRLSADARSALLSAWGVLDAL